MKNSSKRLRHQHNTFAFIKIFRENDLICEYESEALVVFRKTELKTGLQSQSRLQVTTKNDI